MLDTLFILLIAAHLLAMNVATAAPLICPWLKRREVRKDDMQAGRLGRYLAWQSVVSLLVGTVLGLSAAGLLWFKGDTKFFSALAVVPQRRLWFGIVELLFFLGLMCWYAWAWPRVRRPTLWHPLLALLAATDLIYHFPPLFAGIAVLQGQAELPDAEMSYSAFLSLMYSSPTMARVLHFLLASFAVTGGLMLVHVIRSQRTAATALDQRWIAWAARWALIPSVVQLLAGGYLLLVLTRSQQQSLMGGDWIATALFAVSIVAVFGLLHSLASLSLGESARGEVLKSVALLIFVVLTMTAARHQAEHPASAADATREQIQFTRFSTT